MHRLLNASNMCETYLKFVLVCEWGEVILERYMSLCNANALVFWHWLFIRLDGIAPTILPSFNIFQNTDGNIIPSGYSNGILFPGIVATMD